ADLAITKTADTPSVSAGAPITYRIFVTNNGPTQATNVTVTDILPPGTSFVSASPTQGTCSGTTTVVCSAGTLASGSLMGIMLVVNAPPTGPVMNTSTVSSSEMDPVPSNNSATSTVLVTGPAVPTLSEWMLCVLGAALALLALAKLR
ncbi:MAG TPA: DUF11 domain-containing protein, partial [Thermoanaerobaculia bacterium]|nr:DUF11 domain-containing protein [Thermoanaerobaculia bacterium]